MHNFVAEFVGTTNFIAADALGPEINASGDNSLQRVRAPQGDLLVSSAPKMVHGSRVNLSIRPEHPQVGTQAGTGPYSFTATVETQVFLGFYRDLALRAGGATLLARTHPSIQANPGATVIVSIDPACCVVCQ